jgi:transcriptional regulator with XRE-family HTH domain
MKFPNLLWALREKRIPQFELAATVGISESKLSRAIHGRVVLSPEERTRIAGILGYSDTWLFRPMTPSRAMRGAA